MNSVLIALLLQSLLMPPRLSLENPSVVSTIPPKLKKDYDKAWSRFIAAKEDVKLKSDLAKLLKKQKDFDAVLTVQAYLHLYAGRGSEAELKFEQVLGRDSDNRIALYYLAELAYSRNDYARASDLYTRLMEADPSRTDIETKRQKVLLLATENLLRQAARAEVESRFSEAEDLYRHALRIAPREPAFHAWLATVLAKQNKWDDALAHYRRQADLEGQRGETEKNIAEALMNLGRTEEASTILDRLRHAGSADEALELKVRELENLGRWGDAIEKFKEIKAAGAVTREQLSAMFVRYFPQITEFRQNRQIVTDIGDSWARPEIQTIVSVGLIDAFPNHTFRPSAPVTRGELAVALSRLMLMLRLSPSAAHPIPVTDVASANALYEDVQFVLGLGLMSVDEATNFNPDTQVSGEEAVGAMARLVQLARGEGPHLL